MAVRYSTPAGESGVLLRTRPRFHSIRASLAVARQPSRLRCRAFMAPSEFEASLADTAVRLFDALLNEALEPIEVREMEVVA
jgi:hypothetical protein